MFTSWLPFEWIVAIRFLREGRLQTLFIIAGSAYLLALAIMHALIPEMKPAEVNHV